MMICTSYGRIGFSTCSSMYSLGRPSPDPQVIQYARALPCYMNRQFITLLTTLGVPDEPIEELYSTIANTLDEVIKAIQSTFFCGWMQFLRWLS